LGEIKEASLHLKCQAEAEGVYSVDKEGLWKVWSQGENYLLKKTGLLSHSTGYFPREPAWVAQPFSGPTVKP
jgi:hypothetical protein